MLSYFDGISESERSSLYQIISLDQGKPRQRVMPSPFIGELGSAPPAIDGAAWQAAKYVEQH